MKPNFYLMNWCIRKTINTKFILQKKELLLFLFFIFFVCSFQDAFTQESHINCVITDGTIQIMRADSVFPDWYDRAYENVVIRKKDYGNDIVLSMTFFKDIHPIINSNNYTDNSFVGVNNTSMLEFSRLDIAYKLINTKPCSGLLEFPDTVSIRIIQKTPCYKSRFCRIPIDSFMCCNMSMTETGWFPDYTTKPGFELLHQGIGGYDPLTREYFVHAGDQQCGWKCCEIKYKFLCRFNHPNPMFGTYAWQLVGVERSEFENSTCTQDFEYVNPLCPNQNSINNFNPCEGDCNENHF